jgi:hypothetical protein
LFNNVSTAGDGVYFNCSPSQSFYLEQAGAFSYVENQENFYVTASHPTITGGFLSISVNRETLASEFCVPDKRWGQQGGTRVMIPLPSSNELLGKSVSVSCRKNITSIYTS